MRSTSTSGWTKVTVPNVWNLGDASNESMSGGIGWYRKDFELPNADSALAWAFRFESVNYRADGVAQRQADRLQHRRLRAVGARSRAASSGAGRTAWWCAWTPSAASPTSRPPA